MGVKIIIYWVQNVTKAPGAIQGHPDSEHEDIEDSGRHQRVRPRDRTREMMRPIEKTSPSGVRLVRNHVQPMRSLGNERSSSAAKVQIRKQPNHRAPA